MDSREKTLAMLQWCADRLGDAYPAFLQALLDNDPDMQDQQMLALEGLTVEDVRAVAREVLNGQAST